MTVKLYCVGTGKLYRQIARNENVAFSDPQANFCGKPRLFYCKSRAPSLSEVFDFLRKSDKSKKKV